MSTQADATSRRRTFARAIYLLTAITVFGVGSTICAAQVQLRPEIGISLRGVSDGIVEPGEPMRVAVGIQIDDGDGSSGDIVLAPASGTWADAIDVEILTVDGRPTGATATPVGQPDDPIASLGPYRSAGGLWRMSAQTTGSLAPGHYVLRAQLAIPVAAPGSGGWTGEVRSQDITIQIVATSNQPERRAQRSIALAQDAMLDDRLEEAADIIDELLTDQPEHVGAWTVRSVISERAGNIPGAMLSLNRARELYYTDFAGGEPNVDLETIQQRLMAALLAADPATAAASSAAAWSWPPVNKPAAATTTAPSVAMAADGPPPEAASTAATSAPSAVAAAAPPPPVDAVTVVAQNEVDEASILSDARGQWASTATASSEYGNDRYSAVQAAGAPNVPAYADNPNAWCHSGRSVEFEWLELGFAKPVRATEIRVRQTMAPGTLSKVEVLDADGASQVLWEGVDPNRYSPGAISWFVLRFPETEFPVARVRLTLKLAAVSGWKQIDAVQLVE